MHVILVFINHLTREEYLSQLAELTEKAAGWALKSILAVVIGFNTIQGILSPVIDALKSTAFSRAVRAVPGIGSVAGSVTDVLLGSAVLIKNGIGAAALVVMAIINGACRRKSNAAMYAKTAQQLHDEELQYKAETDASPADREKSPFLARLIVA